MKEMDRKVVFYDGDCGFCNRSVQFILDHEKGDELHFCALQSGIAQDFFQKREFPKPDLSTFYYWDGERLWERSSGALRVSRLLKWPWNWLSVFLIIPRFIRDGVYNAVAARRHKLANAQCALPTPEQRKRFIN